jgi:hypothetical protein
MSAEKTTITDSPSKPRRRWLRFSLRFLLLFVVVVAVPLGWKMNRVHHQRLVLAEVKKLNGQVLFDYQVTPPPQYEPPGPRWLKNLVGDDVFTNVHSITIDNPRATDDTLASIVTLPRLEGVKIVSDGVSDTGLLHFARAKDLTALEIGSRKLTDAGLATLTGLKRLNKLSLVLWEPKNTDAGLSHIAELAHLEMLTIDARNVSSDALARIVKLPKLIVLFIDSPFITDADLELMVTARELVHLHLRDTNITDLGLTHLEKMTSLGWVNLSGTKVTAQGAAQLRNALPKCTVDVAP